MKLEAGKRYVRRDGTVTDPLRYYPNKSYPFYGVDNYSWYAKGNYLIGDDHLYDLVAEYVEPKVDLSPLEDEPADPYQCAHECYIREFPDEAAARVVSNAVAKGYTEFAQRFLIEWQVMREYPPTILCRIPVSRNLILEGGSHEG